MLNILATGIFLLVVSLCNSLTGHQSHLNAESRIQSTSKVIEQLATGNHSTVSDPFIFVARDVETYSLLRTILETLPKRDAKFFESSAVVAVFLGQRPTGGYGIDIVESHDASIRIAERRPPKGAMVTTVLTAPYKVVSIRSDQNKGLAFSMDERWQSALRRYRLTSGEVMVTGGFAGISKVLKPEGKIDILRAGDLFTLFFDIRGPENHRLFDVASGKIDKGSKFSLKGLDAFGLAGAVNSPFRVLGEFSDQGRQLSLQLETVASPHVSDNFSASGSLQAKLVE
jgi:hypothetical protein